MHWIKTDSNNMNVSFRIKTKTKNNIYVNASFLFRFLFSSPISPDFGYSVWFKVQQVHVKCTLNGSRSKDCNNDQIKRIAQLLSDVAIKTEPTLRQESSWLQIYFDLN